MALSQSLRANIDIAAEEFVAANFDKPSEIDHMLIKNAMLKAAVLTAETIYDDAMTANGAKAFQEVAVAEETL